MYQLEITIKNIQNVLKKLVISNQVILIFKSTSHNLQKPRKYKPLADCKHIDNHQRVNIAFVTYTFYKDT